MKIKNIDRRIGRTICSFALVGTLVTCVLTLPRGENDFAGSEIANGHYITEDVEKNRQMILDRITNGGNQPVKKYGKTKGNVVPTKVSK